MFFESLARCLKGAQIFVMVWGRENFQKALKSFRSLRSMQSVPKILKRLHRTWGAPQSLMASQKLPDGIGQAQKSFQGIPENTIHSLCQWPLWYG